MSMKNKALGTMVVIDGDMVIYSISVVHVLIQKLLTITFSNNSKRITKNRSQKVFSIMESQRWQQGFHKNNYFIVNLPENIIKVKTCVIMSTYIYKCLFALIMVSGKWRPKHWFLRKLVIKLYYRHDMCNSIKEIVKKSQKAKKRTSFLLTKATTTAFKLVNDILYEV